MLYFCKRRAWVTGLQLDVVGGMKVQNLWAVIGACFVLWIGASASAEVIYMDQSGNVSEAKQVYITDKQPVDVIAILDEGADIAAIMKIHEPFAGEFNFVNPIAASGKYAVLFSITSTNEIIERWRESKLAVNRSLVERELIQDNLSCLIRVIHADAGEVISFNMFVLDGELGSYATCLTEYAGEFAKFSRPDR